MFSPSSFVAFASVLLGIAWVTFTTFRNAQATGSIAQIIRDADLPLGSGRSGE